MNEMTLTIRVLDGEAEKLYELLCWHLERQPNALISIQIGKLAFSALAGAATWESRSPIATKVFTGVLHHAKPVLPLPYANLPQVGHVVDVGNRRGVVQGITRQENGVWQYRVDMGGIEILVDQWWVSLAEGDPKP